MKLAITGTPGVGKTTVAEMVSDLTGWPLLDTNKLLTTDYVVEKDVDREAFMVDIERAASETKLPADCVLDGHLSHFFSVDFVIVLRCRPKELQMRLESKVWAQAKVEENIEAEAMDMISDEARKLHKNVADIDTTGDMPKKTAQRVVNTVSGKLPAERLSFLQYL